MAKVTIKEILSPALRKKLDEIGKEMDKKLAQMIKNRGFKKGEYEKLIIQLDLSWRPRDKKLYPRYSGGGGIIMIIYQLKGMFGAWIPFEQLIPVDEKGKTREEAIYKAMAMHIMDIGRRNLHE